MKVEKMILIRVQSKNTSYAFCVCLLLFQAKTMELILVNFYSVVVYLSKQMIDYFLSQKFNFKLVKYKMKV